jgi:ABC-2 type transport system ATP-binding protein
MTVLAAAGATVAVLDAGSVTVSGLGAEQVAAELTAHGVPFTELGRHRASLEEAYLDLTREATEFRAHAAGPAGDPEVRP